MARDIGNEENIKPCLTCGKQMKRSRNHTDFIWEKKSYCSSPCEGRSYRQRHKKELEEKWKKRWLLIRTRAPKVSDEELWTAYQKGFVH